MQIVIDIPKEFESHFEFDRFADSLARVASDIEALGFKLSGRYERETITMIRKAFENATPLPKGHGRIGDLDKVANAIYRLAERMRDTNQNADAINGLMGGWAFVYEAETIIEADKEDK